MGEKQKVSVLQECHDNPGTGGHQGRLRMYDKVVQSYCWIGIMEDVKQWIARCPQCQRNDTVRTVAPVLHPIKVTAPWTIIGVDLIGPFPVTPQGNIYVLTMTDLFTKCVIAEPLKSKTAAEVAAVVLDKLFEFGVVERIITDQGREFVNKVNEDMFNALGVKQCVTSAYHPQSNGQDERTNQTVNRALAKYCNEEQNDWDKHLKAVVYAINTSKHVSKASTKYTPYFLMFNRYPLMAEALNAKQESKADCFVAESPEVGIDARTAEVTALRAKVLDNIEKAKQNQKIDFESSKRKNVKSFHIYEGKEVLKANKRKEGRKGGRLESNWFGPYISEKGLGYSGRQIRCHSFSENQCLTTEAIPET